MEDLDLVLAYTDGSANNKTKDKGGYGIVMKYLNHTKEVVGGSYSNTTSARMELLGAITILEMINPKFRVHLHCDAQYVINGINQKWLKSWEMKDWFNVKNADLWKRFLKAYRKFPEGRVKMIWIRGHNGHEENEICDKLARLGGQSENVMIDIELTTPLSINSDVVKENTENKIKVSNYYRRKSGR